MRIRARHAFLTVAAIAAAAFAIAGAAHAQEARKHALQPFHDRVESYLSLRYHLESSRPPLEVSPDPERIAEATAALAAAIRAARRDAAMGEIFTADVQSVFQRRIRDGLRAAQYPVEDLLAELNADGPADESVPAIEINDPFPWTFGAPMPSCLIAVLPALPEELQYRFIARDLFLVDVDAGIVVDILLDALPRTMPAEWRVAEAPHEKTIRSG